MRLTWFGGSTFRLYLGGDVFVLDADRAPDSIDAHEVAAAATYSFATGPALGALTALDPDNWRPSAPKRLIDETDAASAEVFALGETGILIDEAAEGPVILSAAGQHAWGRFADDAIVVLFGAPDVVLQDGLALLDAARPLMLGVASAGFSDTQFRELGEKAGKSSLQLLEPGFAVEA